MHIGVTQLLETFMLRAIYVSIKRIICPIPWTTWHWWGIIALEASVTNYQFPQDLEEKKKIIESRVLGLHWERHYPAPPIADDRTGVGPEASTDYGIVGVAFWGNNEQDAELGGNGHNATIVASHIIISNKAAPFGGEPHHLYLDTCKSSTIPFGGELHHVHLDASKSFDN